MTDYFWPHARAALRQIGLTERHAKARRVLRWLRAERKEQVSIEDVRRDALQQSLNAEDTGRLVEALVRAGWLRKAPTEKGGPGRRAHRWLVNPLLWAATDNSVADEVSDDQAQAAGIAEIPLAGSLRANFRNSRNFRNWLPQCLQRWGGDVDGVTLIHRVRDAGLRLEVAGNSLKITGPKEAEPLVRLLAKNKAQVLEALANNGLRELRELRKIAQRA